MYSTSWPYAPLRRADDRRTVRPEGPRRRPVPPRGHRAPRRGRTGTPGGDHVHADPRIRHRASGPAVPPAPPPDGGPRHRRRRGRRTRRRLRHLDGEDRAAGGQEAAPETSSSSVAPGMGSYSAMVLKAAEQNPRLLVDQPGWKAQHVDGFAKRTGSITYSKGERGLRMSWYEATEYAVRHKDRLQVSKPESVQVDRWPGDLFRYNEREFEVLLKPRDGSFVEVRTVGAWTRADFDRVLASVVRVDARTWLASLPAEIVTPERVNERAAAVLADVPLPPGFDPATLNVEGINDPSQFGIRVIGPVGCAWITEWKRAKRATTRTLSGGQLTRCAAATTGRHSSRSTSTVTGRTVSGRPPTGWPPAACPPQDVQPLQRRAVADVGLLGDDDLPTPGSPAPSALRRSRPREGAWRGSAARAWARRASSGGPAGTAGHPGRRRRHAPPTPAAG